MDTAALLLLIVIGLVLAAVAALVARWWTWRPVVTHRFMVQTDADVSLAGVVLSRRGPLLVLADVSVLAGNATSRADGTVIVERSRVLWMQRID